MADTYGRRIVCNVLHDRARLQPDQLFAIVVQNLNIADGFQHVTYQQISQAVNFMSHWLQDHFGKSGKPSQHPALCYIGIPDIRYNIIIYAALQCGYKIFLPSPRNAPDVNVVMLQSLNCSGLVFAEEAELAITNLRPSLSNTKFERIPSITDLLQKSGPIYPYSLSYDENSRDPAIVLHSSGSTGTPKTITWTYGTLASIETRDFPGYDGRANYDFASLMTDLSDRSPSFDVLPPFHAAGVILKNFLPVWFNRPIIFAPATRPPSGALIAQIIRQFKPASIVAPPSMVEQLVQEHDSGRLLQSLQLLIYGGGPLSDETASTVSAATKTVNLYASTECLQVRQVERDVDELPNYIYFNPHEGMRFDHYDSDLYELVMPISEDRKASSALCHNLPHLSEFRTKDVFTRHPTKPALWKFHGRVDDVLVFSSGEKLFPLPMELALAANPKVSGALVVGNSQRQAGLLVELAPEVKVTKDTIEYLWPAIEAANSLLPAHGRISQSMIIFARTEKPFKRTVKGTVVRRTTEEFYAEEIQSLYKERPEPVQAPVSSFITSSFRYEDVRNTLTSIFRRVLADVEITDNENLYTVGLNSIKTVEVVNQIKASLQAARPGSNLDWFKVETVYNCYSISRLTSVLHAFLNDGTLPNGTDRFAEMEAKIAKYTRDLPSSLAPSDVFQRSQLSVAVTGTTGFLGHYLVGKLAEIPRVTRIYCLNRSATACDQYYHKKPVTNTTELIFMTCTFGKPKLGLLEDDYLRLTNNCSIIIHNAWPVHFGLPLDTFEDNIANVRHLVDLSASARYHPRIQFISTYANTGVKAFDASKPLNIPEAPIDGLKLTPEVGYTEAKRVSERILEIATSKLSVPVTIVRLGQLVPEDGNALPTTDNLTFFLETCKKLGRMPYDLLGPVDWIPVNVAAQVLAEIAQSDLLAGTSNPLRYFNVINPKARSWSDYKPVLDAWCGRTLEIVDATEWVKALSQKDMVNGSSKSQEPQSSELIRVWEEFLRRRGPSHVFEYSRLSEISESMKQMAMIEPKSLASWLPHIET